MTRTNSSRDWMTMSTELGLAYDTDLVEVEQIVGGRPVRGGE